MNNDELFALIELFIKQRGIFSASASTKHKPRNEFDDAMLAEFNKEMKWHPGLERTLKTKPNPNFEQFQPRGISPLIKQHIEANNVEYKQELHYAGRLQQISGQLFQAWYWCKQGKPDVANKFIVCAAKELLYDVEKQEQAMAVRLLKEANFPDYIVATATPMPDGVHSLVPAEASFAFARHLSRLDFLDACHNIDNFQGQGNGRGRGYRGNNRRNRYSRRGGHHNSSYSHDSSYNNGN